MSNIYIQSTELLYSSSTITSKTSQKSTDETSFKDFLSINDDKQAKTDEVKQTTSNETINQTNSTTQTNINKIKYSSTAYGYSVDSKGFMGVDFNKAAGLPEDMKIHKSTLEEIEDFNERTNFLNLFEFLPKTKVYANIDMADTIKQYYNVFEQINSQTFQEDKTSYSTNDLSKLPKGYGSKGIEVMDMMSVGQNLRTMMTNRSEEQVTHVFNSSQKMEEANEVSHELSFIGARFHVQYLDFSAKSMQTNSEKFPLTFNPDMSVYENKDGSFSKEAVFMSFLKSVKPHALNNANTALREEASAKLHNMAMDTANSMKKNATTLVNLEKILKNEISILELINKKAEQMPELFETRVKNFSNSLINKMRNLGLFEKYSSQNV